MCPSLQPIPSPEGLHSSDQVHQGVFPARALGAGWPAPILPPFFVFCLRASGKGNPYLFISRFSAPFRLVGRIREELALLFPVVLYWALRYPSHPLITRLVKGVFTKRPPTRKVLLVWNPALVLDCFMYWSFPLSRAQLVRKCAFLFAITSARQLSKRFSLKCIGKHIQINDDFVQFMPSSLSKMDRAGHLGPPIRLRAWKEDASICPVALTCTLLTERVHLDIRHDRLFFDIQRPDAEMSLKSFRRCIRWCLQDAGIEAPQASTSATAASSPLVAACLWRIFCI
jgi:hypothetical protein